MKKNCFKEKRCPVIETHGHRYWVDKQGTDHITFYDNKFGEKLKRMWEQLNEPIRRKKNDNLRRPIENLGLPIGGRVWVRAKYQSCADLVIL